LHGGRAGQDVGGLAHEFRGFDLCEKLLVWEFGGLDEFGDVPARALMTLASPVRLDCAAMDKLS
jgi:hypothetical protein